MSNGTHSDPIVIDPTVRYAWASISGLFSRESDLTKFLRAVSPQIRAAVDPGQCFVFSNDPSRVYVLLEEPSGDLYFMRWPGGRDAVKHYLYADEKPWLQDRYERLKKEFDDANPFSGLDKLKP